MNTAEITGQDKFHNDIKKHVSRLSNNLPTKRVARRAYMPYKDITRYIVDNNAFSKEEHIDYLFPRIFSSIASLSRYYKVPLIDVSDIDYIEDAVYNTIMIDFIKSEFSSGIIYAEFFGNSTNPDSSIIVYNTNTILKGEDAKITVPFFAIAIFHEFFHYLTYYKIPERMKLSHHIIGNAMKSDALESFIEMHAVIFSRELSNKAGVFES